MALVSDVHLSQLRLRDFRNYARLDVGFTPGFHLLLGDNAQGKTNILEAVYLLATLRSFRGSASSQMIRHGQTGYFVGGSVQSQGDHEIKMYWSSREKNLSLDGRQIRKLAEYLGVFRAVIFCSEDLLLVKGPASRRRRFMDLLLAQTQPGYLATLQRYALALRSRNALLKQRNADEMALESFTREVVELGNGIMRARAKLIPELLPVVREAHKNISSGAEEFGMDYRPTVKSDFLVELRQSRAREKTMRTTLVGPHRDELELTLNLRPVAQFGSEGQKRSVVIALKMAQAEFLTLTHGSPPILLIDDIMGDLDLRRRAGFLPLLKRVHEAHSQVFMTCTEENWPAELGRHIQRWRIKEGKMTAS